MILCSINIWDVIIGAVVLICLILAIVSVIKKRKNGGSCSCGCGTCDACERGAKDKKKC